MEYSYFPTHPSPGTASSNSQGRERKRGVFLLAHHVVQIAPWRGGWAAGCLILDFYQSYWARLLISGCTDYVSSNKPANRDVIDNRPCNIDNNSVCCNRYLVGMYCNSRQPKAARYVMPSHALMHKCVRPKAWLRTVPERSSSVRSLILCCGRPSTAPWRNPSPTGEISMDFFGRRRTA